MKTYLKYRKDLMRIGRGTVWGSREHQTQGPSDPQVSKVLEGTESSGLIRAQCWPSQEPQSLCHQVQMPPAFRDRGQANRS